MAAAGSGYKPLPANGAAGLTMQTLEQSIQAMQGDKVLALVKAKGPAYWLANAEDRGKGSHHCCRDLGCGLCAAT